MWFKRKGHRHTAGALALALVCALAVPPAAGASDTATLPIQLVSEQTIGEGAVLQTYNKKISGLNTRVFVTKVDLNNPYVDVRPLYGKNGTFATKQNVEQMAEEKGAVAAVNADFFNMTDNTPFGIVLDKGNLVSSMGRMPYWYSLGILSDHTAIIDRFTYKGQVKAPGGATFPIQGVNKEEYQSSGYASHKDQINMYTPAFGPKSLGHLDDYDDYVEVVVQNNIVQEVRVRQPASAIPANGYVLWGNGSGEKFLRDHFKAGDPVIVSSETLKNAPGTLESAMAGHVLLVDNGTPLNPTANSVRGKVSRSGVGISKDGKTLYLAAAEGPPKGRGMELVEWAVVMKEIGSWRAFNLDGGGSTTMVAQKLADTDLTLLNTPAYGVMRKIPTAIGVFNTAPAGNFKGFFIEGPDKVLKGSTATFSVKAYDEHYHPFMLDPKQVNWSGNGTFNGNVLTALNSGQQQISAEYMGVSQTKSIQVIGAAQVTQVAVEPSIIAANPGQSVNFKVKVKTTDGQWLDVTPYGASATVDAALGSVQGFTFTAGQQDGAGKMTVDFDGKTASVPVSVGSIEQPFETFDNLSGIYHVGLPKELSTQGMFSLTQGSDPVYRTQKAAKLKYNFAGAAPDEIRIAYGVLGSQPMALPGTPISVGLWVYGDNSHHWLRAEISDAKGQPFYMDLAKDVNWTGWQYVKGTMPAGVTYPVKMRSIYLVDMPDAGDSGLPVQGTLYFDEMTLYQPYNAAQVVQPADLAANQSYKLGAELSVKADAAVHINPLSTVPLEMKGKHPAPNGFEISGDSVPTKLSLTPVKWPSDQGIGLLYKNPATNAYEEVKGTLSTNGDWVFPIKALGTYIPVYSEAVPVPVTPPAQPQPGDNSNPFRDVPKGQWYEEAVLTLYHDGIVKGMTDTAFGPDVKLTRAQFVTLLGRWLGWKDDPSVKLSFNDQVPEYAVASVKTAQAKGIVKGYPGNLFKPDLPLSRAEMTVMLYRALTDKGVALKEGQKLTFSDDKAIPEWAAEAVDAMTAGGYVNGMNGAFVPNGTATRAQSAVLIYRLQK